MEWAYDRDTHIGRLDKALDKAAGNGWTVVDRRPTGAWSIPLSWSETLRAR